MKKAWLGFGLALGLGLGFGFEALLARVVRDGELLAERGRQGGRQP